MTRKALDQSSRYADLSLDEATLVKIPGWNFTAVCIKAMGRSMQPQKSEQDLHGFAFAYWLLHAVQVSLGTSRSPKSQPVKHSGPLPAGRVSKF